MLVLIIVIAILGTNLLLGLFVAHYTGYGPQNFNELMTGVTLEPRGEFQRQLEREVPKLGTKFRKQMASAIHQRLLRPDQLTLDRQDEDEEMIVLTLQAIETVNYATILLDELRFQVDAEDDADDADDAGDFAATEKSVDASAAIEDGMDPSDGPLPQKDDQGLSDQGLDGGPEDDSDYPSDSSGVEIPLRSWTAEELSEMLAVWSQRLHSIEGINETPWWGKFIKQWDQFLQDWNNYRIIVEACVAVDAAVVAEVARQAILVKTEDAVASPSTSRRKKKAAKAAPISKTQRWIQSQKQQLYTDLFHKRDALRQAQRSLIQVADGGLQSWFSKQFPIENCFIEGGNQKHRMKQLACIRPEIVSDEEEPKPKANYLFFVAFDHRQRLEFCHGALVGQAINEAFDALIIDCLATEQLAGEWFRVNDCVICGWVHEAEEATAQSKAEWLRQIIAATKLNALEIHWGQTSNVLAVPLQEKDQPRNRLAQVLKLWQRRRNSFPLISGDQTWTLSGSRLRPVTEVEPEDLEENTIPLDSSILKPFKPWQVVSGSQSSNQTQANGTADGDQDDPPEVPDDDVDW